MTRSSLRLPAESTLEKDSVDVNHTFGSLGEHYAANRDLRGLQELGGWKSIELVERYAHVNVDELHHTIDALPWTGGNSGETLPVEKKQNDYQSDTSRILALGEGEVDSSILSGSTGNPVEPTISTIY